jgi:hypothetical protein
MGKFQYVFVWNGEKWYLGSTLPKRWRDLPFEWVLTPTELISLQKF